MAWTGNFNYEIISCYTCKMYFGMTAEFYKQRQEDHNDFYCPSGNAQFFSEKGSEEKLRASLQEETEKRTKAEACCRTTKRSLISTKGVVTKLKKKIEAGTG